MPASAALNKPRQNGRPARAGRPTVAGTFAVQHRQRMLMADLLTVVAWGSIAAAVALWLADGGAAAVSTPATVVTAAGIVTGLAGTDLVLLMLLLAARIPLVDRTIGHDRALEFHRKLGKPSLYLLLAHGLLVATGYGMAEGLDPVSESIALWVLVPDMWLAFVSMVLFLAVVATSLAVVRRRFPYEFWYAIHLLTYAAVGTSLPHQFSVGGLFAEGTWQRWYWLALCSATGAALLYFRVVKPLATTRRHRITVSRVERIAPGVVNIEMTGRHLNQLAGTGGRFFVWRFLARGLWWHSHPFSLSAEPAIWDGSAGADGTGTVRITVRNLGRGSAQLARVRPGTRVAVAGPYGLFGTAARSRNKVVMIGAGIGITPLRALLESTPFTPGDATVVLRGQTAQQVYLGEEILDICRRRGATLFHAVGPRAGWEPNGWLPEDAVRSGYNLLSYAPHIAEADIYICGPSPWANNVSAEARAAGARPEQIHYERFDW